VDEACVDRLANYSLFPDTEPILESAGSGARQGIIRSAERAGFPWSPMTENDNLAQHSGPERGTRPGYIKDYVSGVDVRATPEELEAVQVFSKRLVEDYDYDRERLQTRPQFRVRKRPSDEDRSFPVDIAVFESARRLEDDLFMIVECKKRVRKDGVAQLKLYLDMSPAQVGVWFNSDEHVYLRKIHHKDGRRTYEEIPNIPRKGQRIEDIGLFQRKDLRRPSNLKAVFRDIRNHLAGNVTGITRDEALAQEIINVLFCKIYDEINTGPDEVVTFRSGIDESPKDVKKRIVDLFDRRTRVEYSDVFDSKDSISLDPASLAYVVGELQNYSILEADRDAVGEAFEVFIGPALRGGEGQFFTPRNVVKMVVEILDPEPGEMILDPACGSGGFLIIALEHVWRKLERLAKRKGWSAVQLDRKKREVASRCFRGIDKDSFLAKVTKAYMAIIGDGRGGVFCDHSLLPESEWKSQTASGAALGSFNVVLTNPPFGAQIKIKGQGLLAQFELGHKWKRNKATEVSEPTASLYEHQPPQILFLERCIQFLKPGGRLGIVLPESILGNPSYEYIITFLRGRAKILGIVTLPEALFKTSGKGGTHTKTCVLFAEKGKPENADQIFMAEVKWCGHDSRGNPTMRKNNDGEYVLLDEVPEVSPRWRALKNGDQIARDHIGFYLPSANIRKQIMVPKYYSPEIEAQLNALQPTHNLVSLGSLVDKKVVSIATGTEIGKMAYGTGTIPFIRTSDLTNWEIKADFKHGVSEEIFEEEKSGCDVAPGDILMVRDGTYLIGTAVFVTGGDVPMLFQSHIFRIRILKSGVIDPYLLFVSLNTPVVKAQVRAKQFTQDIIDTLGNRVLELMLPFPRDGKACESIARRAKEIIERRAQYREEARRLPARLQGTILSGTDTDVAD
jgi:type I restriction enzyme M protein